MAMMNKVNTLDVLLGLFLIIAFPVMAVPMPKGGQSIADPCTLHDFRIHLELSEASAGFVRYGEGRSIEFQAGKVHDMALEHPPVGDAVLRLWRDGKQVGGLSKTERLIGESVRTFPDAGVSLGHNFTASIAFQTTSDGTLLAMCPESGKWAPGCKALTIEKGALVYDIGWLGRMAGGVNVSDGKSHVAVLVSRGGDMNLWLDGVMVAEKKSFFKTDEEDHVLKVGAAAEDFGGVLSGGQVSKLQVWQRALPDDEIRKLFQGDGSGANTPDFAHQLSEVVWRPRICLENAEAEVVNAWVQPLERSDHAVIVSRWNQRMLKKGGQIYQASCVMCHGTKELPGSLPTARKFTEETFKNGSDPHSIVRTLTHGYEKMPAMAQFTTLQKYAVAHYIHEEFLREDNPNQYTKITADYLAGLPKGLAMAKREVEQRAPPFYLSMDFGPAMFWTYQVDKWNIVQKGIAIRLDDGEGGVSKGKAWMVYDHDTMQFVTATTGDFINWRSIAFDQSHGTHLSLTGDRHFVNPIGPGWASPEGSWEDIRLLGRDGKRYGPLPKDWAEYVGMYQQGDKVIIESKVHGVRVLESPGWVEHKDGAVFVRTINVGEAAQSLKLRVAPDLVNVALVGEGGLEKSEGFWVATLGGDAAVQVLISRDVVLHAGVLAKAPGVPLELEPMTHGGAKHWNGEIVTQSVAGSDAGPFAVDVFPLPTNNPWKSLVRPGGFDFTPDGKAAIVASWTGDVWRVDGITEPAPAELRWRRIATGLFQPLGVKFRDDDLFVNCRDQLVRLRDLNNDGEIDFLECFNNDHQVTKNFHEFAMGLQVDEAGNFYYAKSARHALPGVVPHHGTLLKISADGLKTEILANGLRAANGVCLNEDGSFFVTDQEGNWTPKNRINRIDGHGFYGNMLGYTDVTDSSDEAMEQPMVWIDDLKDRSPAELVWVPKEAWGNLGGSLLNLSYGMGRAYIVPHEEVGETWQGAVYDLPMATFPSGIMRGRFFDDGALYTCGMTSWASNVSEPGGFYRIRRTTQPANIPLRVHAVSGALKVIFSDPIDPKSVNQQAFVMKTWSLKRTQRYGSDRHDQKVLEITGVKLSEDGRTVTIEIPSLAPTHCYELNILLKGQDGKPIANSMHGTIHGLSNE